MKQKILDLKSIIKKLYKKDIQDAINNIINKVKLIKRNKLILIIIAVIVIVIVIFGMNKLFKNEERQNDINTFNNLDFSQLSVSICVPRYDTIIASLAVTGVIVPFENVVITTGLTNLRVKEVYAEVGDVVKKGQKLVLLDNDSLSYQYLQLKEEYERVYDEYARAERLKHSEAITKAYYIQKLKTMEVAKAKMQEAQLNLERSLITAPEEGIIYERKATMGALITNDNILYQLAYNGKTELEAEVPETLISKLKIGQEVIINLNGFTTERNFAASQEVNLSRISEDTKLIIGKIRLIQQNINSLTRAVKVRISYTNELFLPIGLFASAEIITDKVSGMVLPASSLQEDNTGTYLWKVNSVSSNNKVTKLPVKIKLRNSDYIVIEDIMLDTKVVVQAGIFLNEDDYVKIVE